MKKSLCQQNSGAAHALGRQYQLKGWNRNWESPSFGSR